MAKDRNYNRLIHTTRWLTLRREVLNMHPCCQRCDREGRYNFATEVHHVTPCENAISIRAMEQLMFDRGNLMALCHDCHVEMHKELGRSGKAATRRINEARLEEVVEKFF